MNINEITMKSLDAQLAQASKMDIDEMILSAMLQRSNNVYDELEGLTNQMKGRNNLLSTLGAALAAVQGQMSDTDTSAKDISKVKFTDPVSGKEMTLGEFYTEHPELKTTSIDLTKVDSSGLKSLVTSLTSKQDSLNNDSQSDTLRIQSMTSAYNKCFDMASNVITKSSTTKSGIISNLKS